ncbi:hypothetical protein O181_052313 [Austropuccinia psidii MF-1]|uniref:Chromo domain-containing protein n=1 Tax=Austropuccinia psidii MF-1 TaxID=1389203 RepID=A0A9Q3E2D7_9BASI|nr:hypothetical protein [Austropuccinia psidii MF-1]
MDSNESPALFSTHYTKWVVELPSFPGFEWDFFIIHSSKDSRGIKASSNNSLATAVNSVALVGELKIPSLASSVHIPSIIPFQSLLQSRDEVFKEIKDVEEDVAISSLHLFQGDMDLPPLSFHASLEEKWDEEEDPEEIENMLKVVPPAYHQYLDVFSKLKAEKPPPHCACDHHIELEGLLPQVGVIYSLSNQESETLWVYISENVEKGFTRPSSSSTGAPVFFLKEKDGGLCLCVDYHKPNAVTGKNRDPVPPMNQLLTIFNGSTNLFKIELCGAHNLLRIKEGDNIMVFSTSEEEHAKHVASVLQILRDNDLFSKASKCVFHASSVEYLGYVVSSDGLKMDSSKIQQIINWPQPRKIKALESFLGFANFYCCFIKNNSKEITAPTSLLKKYSPFISIEEALSQFQILKEAFTTAPILSHVNPSLPTIVETDASDYDLGAVLSQVNDSGKHPIAFNSHNPLPAELNYEIHEKELLGIVWALKHQRAFLLFQILLSHVFSKHGLPKLKISRDLSTAFHPETDGQTERVNQILEQYLQMYVSYHQDDWHTWLPLAEFAYNNAENSSTKQSPFFTIYGRNPSFDSIHISQDSPAGKLSTKLQSVQQVVKEELESAIRRFKKYADRNRAIPPDFQPGDKVWLASKNIKTTRPTKKLSERWLGPFEVLKKIGSHAYHLKLPQQWKTVHPVFHVSLLEPVKHSTIPNCHQLPPPPVLVEEQEEWEVAQVLDSKLKRGKLWYLVEWKGFSEDPERTTWEPASNLTNSPDLVKDFHSLYPDKPGPNTSRV